MPTFSFTSAASAVGTVTLADIEREVATRLGPYHREQAASGGTNEVVVTAFLSTLEQGGLEDLYLLRRGLLADGTAVPSFVATDRIRTVKQHDALTGTLTVDRDWTTPPVATEWLELHHLDPAKLREAVRAGLRRCYFTDRVSVTLASAAAERSLTASLAWLTDPAQVQRVESLAAASTALPTPLAWARPFARAGAVWLAASPDPYPSSLLVTARRSHYTYVNGADSSTGPTADADTLAVDLEYAAAAGHIEAWRHNKARLQEAAQAGLAVSQQEAANTFSAIAAARVRAGGRRVGFSTPYGHAGLSVVVNG